MHQIIFALFMLSLISLLSTVPEAIFFLYYSCTGVPMLYTFRQPSLSAGEQNFKNPPKINPNQTFKI